MFAETSCESESSRDATQGRAHNNTSELLSRVQLGDTEICESAKEVRSFHWPIHSRSSASERISAYEYK
jgi:hypothetical protein